MFCPNCGLKIETANAKFCQNCGAMLAGSTAKKPNPEKKHISPTNNELYQGHTYKGGVSTSRFPQRYLPAVIIAVVVGLVVLIAFIATSGGDKSEAIVGTWNATSSIYKGNVQSLDGDEWKLVFYSDGTLNDSDDVLGEEFDPDGDIVSWEILDENTIKFTSTYREQYILGFEIKSGTLILDFSEYYDVDEALIYFDKIE